MCGSPSSATLQFPRSAYYSTLMMEAENSSEASINTSQITWSHVSEDYILRDISIIEIIKIKFVRSVVYMSAIYKLTGQAANLEESDWFIWVTTQRNVVGGYR
jgi:hypothetical protein